MESQGACCGSLHLTAHLDPRFADSQAGLVGFADGRPRVSLTNFRKLADPCGEYFVSHAVHALNPWTKRERQRVKGQKKRGYRHAVTGIVFYPHTLSLIINYPLLFPRFHGGVLGQGLTRVVAGGLETRSESKCYSRSTRTHTFTKLKNCPALSLFLFFATAQQTIAPSMRWTGALPRGLTPPPEEFVFVTGSSG